MSGIFESPSKASALSCNEDNNCEVLDMSFPLEEALIPPLIQLVLQELLGGAYRPEDDLNNASDDLSKIAM
jgi:hypothetical protein